MNQPTSTPGIKQKEDGTFLIDCIKRIDGKRVHIYASGFSSVEQASTELTRRMQDHYEQSKLQSRTLESFLDEFHDYRSLHVRHSTLSYGKSIANSYLKPYLETPLESAFIPANVRQIYKTILDGGFTSEYKNRCISLLRLMVQTAFKWKYICPSTYQDSTAILESIPDAYGAKRTRLIWTKTERQRFLSSILDPEDNLLFDLLLSLGARIGEFAGLTWDCVDFRKGKIEIKQQLVYEQAGSWILSPYLKTRESYRTCKLPSRLLLRLKEQRENHPDSMFLFSSPFDVNAPLSKTSIRRKLDHYIALSGVRRITPHCFRHDLATRLLRVCKDYQEVKAAARYLGHSATMLLDTYGHSDEETTLKVFRRLEKEG